MTDTERLEQAQQSGQEPVSRNFIEQIIDKEARRKAYMTVCIPVFRRSLTATSISDMPRASC